MLTYVIRRVLYSIPVILLATFLLFCMVRVTFDPTAKGTADFYVISGRLRLFSSFEAVTSVTLLDAGGEAGVA